MINTEASLKTIMSSISSNYLMGLREKDNGFTGVSWWEIIDYLYTNHSNIEYEDFIVKKVFRTNPFYPTQPIFNIFNHYNDVITIYNKGGQPISTQYKIS